MNQITIILFSECMIGVKIRVNTQAICLHNVVLTRQMACVFKNTNCNEVPIIGGKIVGFVL